MPTDAKKCHVLVLNGASCSGKSTLAAALQTALPTPRRIVALDTYFTMLPDQSRPVTEQQVYDASLLLNAALSALCAQGESVIVDHVITSARVFTALADALRGVRVTMVKITCANEELLRREAARPERVPGTALDSATHLFPQEGYDLIADTTSSAPETCAARIAASLQGDVCAAMPKLAFLLDTGLTNAQMAAYTENALLDYVRAVCAGGKRPLFVSDDLAWVRTYPTAWSNFILRFRAQPEETNKRILEVIEGMKSSELPDEWLIGPASAPDDLRQRLLAYGFAPKYEMAGMAIDLKNTDLTFTLPDGVTIREVTTKQQLAIWAEVISVGLWNGAPFEAALFEGLLNAPEYKFYLAYLGDEPVTGSMLQIVDGIASIDMIATLRQHQGKGIGTAMTKAPLAYAKAQGCRIGVLQASRAGDPVYRKIGFLEYCRFYVLKRGA